MSGVVPESGAMQLATVTVALVAALSAAAQSPPFRSPLDVAVSPDGGKLYVSDRTAGCVVVLDAAEGRKTAEVAIGAPPLGNL